MCPAGWDTHCSLSIHSQILHFQRHQLRCTGPHGFPFWLGNPGALLWAKTENLSDTVIGEKNLICPVVSNSLANIIGSTLTIFPLLIYSFFSPWSWPPWSLTWTITIISYVILLSMPFSGDRLIWTLQLEWSFKKLSWNTSLFCSRVLRLRAETKVFTND